MSEFYEPDESAEKVVKAFDSDKKGTTSQIFEVVLDEAVKDGTIIMGDFRDPKKCIKFKNIKGI